MSYRTLDSIDRDIAKMSDPPPQPHVDRHPAPPAASSLPPQREGPQPDASGPPMIHEITPADLVLDDRMLACKPMNDRTKLLMIYAPWCGACNATKPLWNTLASNIPNVTFLQLDGDKYPEFISKIGVKGFPTFVGFKGNRRAVFKGPRSPEGFVTFLNGIITSQ